MSKPSLGPHPPKPKSGEPLRSAMDNPFYKLPGRRSPRSPAPVSEIPAFLKSSRNCYDTEDLRDFKPGAGHVHKLSGKFASLGLGESTSLPKLKHASSADDILDERGYDSGEQTQQVSPIRPWASKLNHRVGSAETLSPRRAPPVFPISLRHVGREWEPMSSAQKSPRGVRAEAPDIKFARDDIILIENPPEPPPPPQRTDAMEEEENLKSEVPSLKDESDFAEMHKLNTVSTVRGIFEVATPHNSTSVSAAQAAETSRSDEASASGISVSQDAVTCHCIDPVNQDVNKYSGINDKFQATGICDMQEISGELADDPSHTDNIQLMLMNKEISYCQEEHRSLTLTVKTDDTGESDTSRSSTPPPLPLSPPPAHPLSPPPALPLSPPPALPLSSSESSMRATDIGNEAIQADELKIQDKTQVLNVHVDNSMLHVQDNASRIQPDVFNVKADVLNAQVDVSNTQGDVSNIQADASNAQVTVPALEPRIFITSESESLHPVPPLSLNPLSQSVPVPSVSSFPSIPPPQAAPRSVATVRATPVYHPIPFRSTSSTGAFRTSSVTPPSFTPNIKKSSPIVSVAPFRQNRAEDEAADNHYRMFSKSSNSPTPKRDRLSKDYCEVIVEQSVKIVEKEADAVKGLDVNAVVKKTDEAESNDEKTAVTDEEKELGAAITQEADEVKDSGVNPRKEMDDLKEKDESVPQQRASKIEDAETDSNTEAASVNDPQTGYMPVDDAELKPDSSTVDPEEPTENLWRLALKPVSRHPEDAQPRPVTVAPVPIPAPSSTPAFLCSPRKSSQSQVHVPSVGKAKTSQPPAENDVHPPQTGEEGEVDVKSKAGDNFPAGSGELIEVDMKSKGNQSDVSTGGVVQSDQTGSADFSQPIRGIPTIIANRLKQNSQNKRDNTLQSQSPGELFGVRLNRTQPRHNSSTRDDGDDIPHKRFSPAADKPPSETSADPEIVNQFANVLKRKDPSKRNRTAGVSKIFDSSQLQKKRKENTTAKAAAEGQNQGPVQIPPCNIEFMGANISTGRSLLGKTRKAKINVKFHEKAPQTFEYPCEEDMLQEYLQKHPEEVLVLENMSWPMESSSDSFDIRELLRRGGLDAFDGGILKSNTSLAHSGSLQTYRGKYHQEYELGSILNMPDKPPEQQVDPEPSSTDPDAMQLVPATEEELQNYSLGASSDLLF